MTSVRSLPGCSGFPTLGHWLVWLQQPEKRYLGRGGIIIREFCLPMSSRRDVLSRIFLNVANRHATTSPARWYLPPDLYGRDCVPSNCSNLYDKLLYRSKITLSLLPITTVLSFSSSEETLFGDAIQPGMVRSSTSRPCCLKLSAQLPRLLAPSNMTFSASMSDSAVENTLTRKPSGLEQDWKSLWTVWIRVLTRSQRVSFGSPFRVTGRELTAQKVILPVGASSPKLCGSGILYVSMLEEPLTQRKDFPLQQRQQPTHPACRGDCCHKQSQSISQTQRFPVPGILCCQSLSVGWGDTLWHPATFFRCSLIFVYLFVICFRACNDTIYSDGLQNIQDQFIHCI